ncbi:MAG: hypothetical protein ABJO67_09385 [Pseudoruegeria sp.]
MTQDLDQALRWAHANKDFVRLIGLYEAAAVTAEENNQAEAAAFYRTHAYVFALQVGDLRGVTLQYKLYLQGREDCPEGFTR